MINFASFWDAMLASLAPVVVGFFVVRTQRFKDWRAARKEKQDERREIPSVLRDIRGAVNALAESDSRRTMQFESISEKLDKHTEQLDQQSMAIADVASVAYGQMDQDANPRFACDSAGANRIVNTAYARLLRVGRDDLMEYRYRQFIPEKLNPDYAESFSEAVRQHRTYESDVIFCRPDDSSLFLARIRLAPHPEAPPATHWHGTVRYLREHTE